MEIESIVDLAKRHMELWIIKGEYGPGQKLKEEEIAMRLGISRPPIREAFKALETEGLVVRKPRRGVFVTAMTAKDVWEAYTLKAALYEMATELAMVKISSDQNDALDAIVRRMEDCITEEPVDLLQYQDYHQSFHHQIMIISGHDRLKKISVSIHNQVGRFSYRSLQDQSHLKSSVRYHRKIINAIKAKNKPLACRLMKEHVLEALDVLMSMPGFEKENVAAEQPAATVMG
jgi:DNA-binding GntR family transcriptional regulator